MFHHILADVDCAVCELSLSILNQANDMIVMKMRGGGGKRQAVKYINREICIMKSDSEHLFHLILPSYGKSVRNGIMSCKYRQGGIVSDGIGEQM